MRKFRDPGRDAVPCEHGAHGDRSDDELMLLARGGAVDAFAELVRRHQAFALQVAYKYLGSTGSAKDAVQNAFVAVYQSRRDYRPHGKFKAYLRRILLNECRMSHRSAQYEQRARQSTACDAALENISDDAILAREQERELHAALARLPDKLREVVVLRFAGGLSYREVADAVGVPVGTVKSRLFSGLARLRRYLGERP